MGFVRLWPPYVFDQDLDAKICFLDLYEFLYDLSVVVTHFLRLLQSKPCSLVALLRLRRLHHRRLHQPRPSSHGVEAFGPLCVGVVVGTNQVGISQVRPIQVGTSQVAIRQPQGPARLYGTIDSLEKYPCR